jgi:putative ABC transport system substrate-binding protein
VRAQQPAMPVVAFVNASSAEASAGKAAAFRRGLGEAGYIEGQNTRIEYYWLEGQFERVPALMADLVRRRVAVIATPGTPVAAIAAKAATTSIPVVFGVGDDPVKLGLVASLARPGGNTTGTSNLTVELPGKRLELLKAIVPQASRVAVVSIPRTSRGLVNQWSEAQAAANTLRLTLLPVEVRGPEDFERADNPKFVAINQNNFAMQLIRFGEWSRAEELAMVVS